MVLSRKEKKQMNDNSLKVGDIAYILGRYTPDGDTKIVEIEIIKAWNNGKVLAYTTGNEPGEWKFYQSYYGKVVFHTREEAEKALKQEENHESDTNTD